MTSEPARGPWLVPALVGLVAAAGGLGAGWYLRGGTARPEAPARALERETSEAVTREQLEAFKAEFLAQLRRVTRPRADGTNPAAATPDAAVYELGRRIDEIDARIALLDTRAPRKDDSKLWTPPKGPGSGSIEAIIERMQAWYGDERKRATEEDLEEQLKKEHDLWAFEDVVRAYGPPRHWEREDKDWTLDYGSFPVSGWEENQTVRFGLRDGYVAWVSIEECQP